MSLIVTLQAGDTSTDVHAQRIEQDALIEGNFLIQGVSGLTLGVNAGDTLIVHTMSVPKSRVIAYYGGDFVSRDEVLDAAGALLKEASLRKAKELEPEFPREWPGIEGTTFSA